MAVVLLTGVYIDIGRCKLYRAWAECMNQISLIFINKQT